MAQPGQPSAGVEDADAFGEACAVFGDAAALAHLQAFRAELAEQISRLDAAPPDPAALREVAHRTVGRAGTLGFPTLAEASARLDEALLQDAGVATALERWTQAARRAAAPPAGRTDLS